MPVNDMSLGFCLGGHVKIWSHVTLMTNQIIRKIMCGLINNKIMLQNTAGLTATSKQHCNGVTSRRELLNVSSPDSLIIQPAGCTAGKAVIVRCPQLGRRGHPSWDFLAGPLGVWKWEGVAGAGSLVVKHHTYTGRHRDGDTIPTQLSSKSINL